MTMAFTDITRVQIFLSTGFLSALGVTVSLALEEWQERDKLTKLTGPDYLCDEPPGQ